MFTSQNQQPMNSLQGVVFPDNWAPHIWNPRTASGDMGMGGAPQPNPTNFTYSYSPQQWTPPQGVASLANLYGNTSSPWYIGGGNAQPNAQAGSNMGGWNSSSFMQGLQSLGYSL